MPNLTKTLKIIATAAIAITTSLTANASLLTVEQYDDFWNQNVTELINYASNNEASTTTVWSYIDFTDDPNGFAGVIPGSNPWPSAEQAGVTGTTADINQTFFVRITADFYVDATDTFNFQTYSDDGVFLYIDDQLIISDPTLHAEAINIGSIDLDAGMHDIELYFFENGGEASLEFLVADSSLVYEHFDVSSAVSLSITPSSASIPEPATSLLFLAGLCGLASRRFRITKWLNTSL